MSAEAALIGVVLVPLLGALAVVLAGSRPNLREAMSLGAGVALLALVMRLLPRVLSGDWPTTVLAEPIPGLALAFSAEPLGVLFGLIASFLWIVTTVYSIGYMRGHGEAHQTRFYAFFAIAMGCTMGVAFADNLFTLFVFYELLTLSTYPLVTHAGDSRGASGWPDLSRHPDGNFYGVFTVGCCVDLAIDGQCPFYIGRHSRRSSIAAGYWDTVCALCVWYR